MIRMSYCNNGIHPYAWIRASKFTYTCCIITMTTVSGIDYVCSIHSPPLPSPSFPGTIPRKEGMRKKARIDPGMPLS